MGYEISAGIILCRQQPEREYLLLDYGSHWDFPKGHIEPGEEPVHTARRELEEETGVRDVDLLPGFERRIQYFYRRASEQMRKEVVFFLAVTPIGVVTLSHEHYDYVWLPYPAALARLTFPTGRSLLEAAEQHLLDQPVNSSTRPSS
jgi:bis(5'-nucleosidyl)-tetraphosphatase